MNAFLVSTGVVALGEIGDKTQLLALMLAMRFRKPVPVILGILVATIANHLLAGLVGAFVRDLIGPDVLRWVLGASFVAVGIWALFPDKIDEDEATPRGDWGVFGVTVVTFFLAEIGDKTQLATVMLAARFDSLVAVVSGTTLGMLIADVPAVLLGRLASPKLPLKWIRLAAAAVFIALGAGLLLGLGS